MLISSVRTLIAAIKLGKSVFGTAGSNMVATKEKGTSQSTLTP